MLAANRDERIGRAWDPPGPYWPSQPGVVAGRDRLAGGTWIGVNPDGVVATILNRPGSLGPADGKRSRGELPLLALTATTARAAAAVIATLDGAAYRSFNMVIADRAEAWFVRNEGAGPPTATLMTPGLHMVTAHDPDDMASPRVARHRPLFAAAAPPAPPDWTAWEALLANSAGPYEAALAVKPQAGFGTVNASLFGLPAQGKPIWRFAHGRVGEAPFEPVTLP